MTDTPWTKGPWECHEFEYRGDNPEFIVGPGKYDTVAHVRMGHDDLEGDPLANARLISAAPDMAEALEKFLDHYVRMVMSGDCGFWNPEDEDVVMSARAAVAKARGTQ